MGVRPRGAEALINTFRLLAEAPETEVPLHELVNVDSIRDIQVFATNASGPTGVQQLSRSAFR
jgi:hypothetical protein